MVREWCWAVSAIFSIHRPSRIWVSWAAKRMDIQTVSHPKEHLMPWTIQSDIEIFVFFPIAGLNPDIQAYLDEHLFRSFSQKSTVNIRQSTARPRQLRRRMSCKGAIKKTRSINADSEYLLFSKVIISSDFHHPHRHRGGWMLRMTFSYSVQLLNDIAAYGSWLYPLRMDFSCKFCFTCQYTIAIS